jgi:hypothetical protein
VTITGTGFTAASTVSFGSSPAKVSGVSSTSITATAPALATDFVGNTVPVTVTTSGQASAASVAAEFTYTYNNTANPTNPISLTQTATSVPAGTASSLTITATSDVGPTDYGLTILDVTNPAVPTVVVHAYSGTSVSAQVSESTAQTQRYVAEYDACSSYPAACPVGPASAVITLPSPNDGAVSAPVTVTWTAPVVTPSAPAPTVTGILPSSGFTFGGTLVIITGTNFSSSSVVHFGSATAGTVIHLTSGLMFAFSPANSAGTVNITVTTAGVTSATSAADHFTYVGSILGLL